MLMKDYTLRSLYHLVRRINQYASEFKSLTDAQLQDKTAFFKQQLENGKTLDEILPEAFAVVREADRRVLGMFPFDVQVMGGIVLHQGNVAEMKTGEGKTLTATMPLYLNALTGQSTLLITANEYLAKRDAAEMGKVYQWLGLSCSCGVTAPDKDLKPVEKRAIYAADIVYTTSGTFGFDYLLDNLASNSAEKYMRPFGYAIVDEVDQVLLDSAQTPLVISGAPRVQSNMYRIADNFIQTLSEDQEYKLDEERKSVGLTPKGITAAEHYFRLSKLYDGQYTELLRQIMLALRAHTLFENGKDYVVEAGEIKLLDEQNGRVLEMTKLQSGQHQALEARENLDITPDMRAMASITFQNLFRKFKKLGGMTGTGKTAEEEFIETYYMKVVRIPTNRPIIRRDLPDLVYSTLPEKLLASLDLVKKLHQKGQPILLVTQSVELSEIYSELLLREQIPHNVLNARNAAKEAAIIAEAGQRDAVTVATSMAGRGTDIKLGTGVAELGGLAVIGTEKMTNHRVELQLRGRAGRQGDPGMSRFFVSLEDEVVFKFGARWLRHYFENHSFKLGNSPKRLKSRLIYQAIQRAQNVSDNNGYQQRKSTLEFDESVRIQREEIYKQRDKLIFGTEHLDYQVKDILKKQINTFVKNSHHLTQQRISRFIWDNISYSYQIEDNKSFDQESLTDYLYDIALSQLHNKINSMSEGDRQSFFRLAILKAIDNCWIEEVDNLQQLRTVVSARQYAQRNPIYEYHQEAMTSFKKMKSRIMQQIIKNLLLSSILTGENGESVIYFS
jgi:preprotein translocase subunit SecA